MNGRFLINRRDARVMGVAAGLADLVTGPVMIFFYVLTGLLAPQQ